MLERLKNAVQDIADYGPDFEVKVTLGDWQDWYLVMVRTSRSGVAFIGTYEQCESYIIALRHVAFLQRQEASGV